MALITLHMGHMQKNIIHNKDNAGILKTLPDGCIDLILEDPPYNTTNLKFEYALDLEKYWLDRWRVLKPNGAIIITATQPFTTDVINSCREYFKYSLVWQKTQPVGFLDANRRPMRAHEDVLIFYKSQPVYNPQKTVAETTSIRTAGKTRGSEHWNNFDSPEKSGCADKTRYPTTVITIKSTRRGITHPTQKPVDLFAWLIKSYTNPGALVFDGFAGSGTTAVACIQNDRDYICCEWDANYFASALERINKELSNAPRET